MAWPMSQDYNEAIQNPQLCFGDPELKRGGIQDCLRRIWYGQT